MNTNDDLISRQDAIALIIKAIHGTDNKEIQEYLFDGLRKQMWSLPSAEPKTVGNTNVNEIYNYLKERIGDIVDDMREFDDWFERMVWHVKECDRLAKETKTGEWIHGKEISRDYIGDACVGVHYDKWWCSNCNYTIEYYRPLWKYCPMCGAKMVREDGEA